MRENASRPNRSLSRAVSLSGKGGLLLAPGLLGLVAWQAVVLAAPRYEFFVGSPLGVLTEGARLFRSGQLLLHAGITATEALAGFLLGTTLGTAIGLGLAGSKTLLFVARPYLMALGALPAFALGPVLIFWLGTGIWSKVALAFLSTLVIAILQAYTGAHEADPNLQNVARAFGGTKLQVFWKVIVPSSAVWVLSGIRLNIGMALLGAFIGEFIASRAGLGHLIIVAEGLYNVNQIWVGILGIIAVALSFQAFAYPAERLAKRWQWQR